MSPSSRGCGPRLDDLESPSAGGVAPQCRLTQSLIASRSANEVARFMPVGSDVGVGVCVCVCVMWARS